MKRALSIMMAGIFAIGIFIVAPPATAAAASYTHNCSEDIHFNPSPHPNYQIYRWDDTTTAVMRGVAGDILNVQNLFTCANPSSSYHGFTAILPANLQQYNGNGHVQLGIAENNYAGTSIGYHLEPVFVATEYDGGGVLVDVNWAETPQYGHNYGFAIDMAVCPAGMGTNMPCWLFTIYDNTDGQQWTHYTHRHWNNSSWAGMGEPSIPGGSYGSTAWYGYETSNQAGLMGRKNSDTPTKITYPRYRHTTNGWITHSSTSINTLYRRSNGTIINPTDAGYPIQYWRTYTGGGSGDFWAYTNAW